MKKICLSATKIFNKSYIFLSNKEFIITSCTNGWVTYHIKNPLTSATIVWYFISCSTGIRFNVWSPSFNWKSLFDSTVAILHLSIFIEMESYLLLCQVTKQYSYSHQRRFHFLYLLLATPTSVPLLFSCYMILIILHNNTFKIISWCRNYIALTCH